MYRPRIAQPPPFSRNNMDDRMPYRPTFNGKKQIEQRRTKKIDQSILRMDELEKQQINKPTRPKYKFTQSQRNSELNPPSNQYGMSGAVYRPAIAPRYQQPGAPYTNIASMYENPCQTNYNPYCGNTQGPQQYVNHPVQVTSSSQWDAQANYQPYHCQSADVYQQQYPFPQQQNCYEPMRSNQFFTQPAPRAPQQETPKYQQPQTSLTQMPPKKENRPMELDKTHNSSNAKKKPAPPERVFLAVNVHGIYEWSNYKSLFFPIFEIIGTLDSQVTTTKQCKAFTLRDGQNRTVECVFYETDRPLPAMRRRTMYRCVGEFNSSREVLLCVSIRATSDAEIQAHRKLIAVTNLNMKKRIITTG